MDTNPPLVRDIWSADQPETQGVDPWRAAVAAVAAITVLRVLVLFSTRLELYPD